MTAHDPTQLTFDWATAGRHRFAASSLVEINEETLRDGLQSPSVTDPPIAKKIRMLHMMEALGIECASMGMPGAGPRQNEDVTLLCQEIVDAGLGIRPNLGGRTLIVDIEPMVEIVQRTGVAAEACLFIGSSPMRQYAEEWRLDDVLRHTRDAVAFAVNEGLPVTYITEDTVRSAPRHLKVLLEAAVDSGARRVCLCDTAGSAIPAGVANLVEWVRGFLDERGDDVGIDWHGHRDRGLGMANALAAIHAGASRIHGTVLGIGERVGNTPTEQLLVNLQLLGLSDRDLSQLPAFVEYVSEALGVSIPAASPVVGRDAFRTATGVHAAAIVKARARGDSWVADRIYSGVPASWLGRRQAIEVGPLSGRSNVIHFLRECGLPEDSGVIEAVLATAKASKRVLTEREVAAVVADVGIRQ